MRAAAFALVLALAAPATALQSPPHSSGVPPLSGRVVDLADILDPAAEAALTALLAAHEDSTSNQVVVLTIRSLEGEVLEQYATRVFRAWGLGQADRDNGALLLVAVEDRELRIEVGYGLEGDLTDATSGSIIRNEIVPRFREDDYQGGVLAGVSAVLGAIDGTYSPSDEADDVSMFFLGLFALGWLFLGGARTLGTGGVGWRGDLLAGLFGAATGSLLGFGVFQATDSLGWIPGLVLVAIVGMVLVNRWLEEHPVWGPKRRHQRAKLAAFRRARKRGASSVVVDGRSYSVPTGSSSDGGFSGGGGSSGGGGASGSW